MGGQCCDPCSVGILIYVGQKMMFAKCLKLISFCFFVLSDPTKLWCSLKRGLFLVKPQFNNPL